MHSKTNSIKGPASAKAGWGVSIHSGREQSLPPPNILQCTVFRRDRYFSGYFRKENQIVKLAKYCHIWKIDLSKRRRVKGGGQETVEHANPGAEFIHKTMKGWL